MMTAGGAQVYGDVYRTSKRRLIEEQPVATTAPETYDRVRGWRIRTGRQTAVDVPVASLRVLVHGSAHARDELRRALGEKTVEGLLAEPAQAA